MLLWWKEANITKFIQSWEFNVDTFFVFNSYQIIFVDMYYTIFYVGK